MISEGPGLIETLSPRLQEALQAELASDEPRIVSVRGGTSAALAATSRRLITLFEPGVLEAGASVRVESYPWAEVRDLAFEERPAGGRVRWQSAAGPATFEVPAYDIAKYRRVVERLKALVPAPARRPEVAMEEKPCPKCRSVLPGGAAFCPVCGLQILDVCWECGEPLQGDWAYCSRCGTSAAETGVLLCPSCREPVARGQRYCPNCGSAARTLCAQCGETMRREWRFCPECGAPGSGDAMEATGSVTGGPVPERDTPVSRPPSSANPQAAALNEQGIAAFQAERFEEAVRLFRRAVELEPLNANFHARLAAALDELDSDDEALAEYQRALELNPRETTALLNLGYLYSEQERYDEARELWEQVIRINPRSPEAKDARENLQHLDEL